MTDREKHRVAVVVFAEVEAVDHGEAAYIARRSVRAALADGGLPAEVGFDHRSGQHLDATVHDVMDLGMAARDGYLWTTPTSRAYPHQEG